MNPLRVTFVATTYRMGGAEASTFELGRRMMERGDQVDVVSLREPGVVGDMFREAGVPVVAGLADNPKDPRTLWKLIRHFRRRRTEAVYFLDHTNAVFWGIPAARLAGVPVRLMVFHTTGLADGGSSLPSGVRLVLGGVTRAIATARGQQDYLMSRGVPSEKLVIIRNGVETARPVSPEARGRRRTELGLTNDDLAVGMVAMLRPEKGHEVLFEAVKSLRSRFPTLRVFLVGDGPRREELVTSVDRMGLGGVIRFMGLQENVPELVAAFDVVVLTSYPRVETLPFSLLEALSQSVPAVATRVGSLPEIVEDGGAGYLVEPGDPVAFGEALARVLGDPELRRRLGTQGRDWVCREFNVERVVSQTRDLIKQCL